MENDENNPDEREENVYSDEGREESMSGDEISPEEDAFMQGYDEDENEDHEGKKKEKENESEEE